MYTCMRPVLIHFSSDTWTFRAKARNGSCMDGVAVKALR